MRISRREALAGSAATLASLGAATAACRTDSPRLDDSRQARPTAASSNERSVVKLVPAQRTMDGAGVRLKRALGGSALPMLDPFLLLDEFQSDDPNDYLAGFPDHPHRGFETVTYMIDGAMEHKDSVGNRGRLVSGSAQWMTAGHGIVHSEMPKQERGLMWGYQLWVNLPRSRKMIRPRYQDIGPGRIPEIEHEGARIRVVAGEAFGTTGPVEGIDVEPVFLDVAMKKGMTFSTPLPPDHNAFVYVADGAVRLGPSRTEASRGTLALLGSGDRFSAMCDADSGRMLVLAGRPIGEPVARRGPFVMNTEDEIKQAWEDYRSGRLVGG
ncbi:Pirin [Labilithrix luteola]|uniref:Pirin n=1 Tax=Labilithrix luteola TaxID=1391654 RepID=A0A0K1QF72_9BACT|nr:pirin family protein [Labilithrix luteola]AKV04085.1 Pirin [Labilithrix luteola]